MMRSILGFVCVVSVVAGSLRAAPVIDWVTVGDPGKAADTDPIGYGAVSYTYQIMKYEFTSQQSVDFLNAVDPQGSNPKGSTTSSPASMTAAAGCCGGESSREVRAFSRSPDSRPPRHFTKVLTHDHLPSQTCL